MRDRAQGQKQREDRRGASVLFFVALCLLGAPFENSLAQETSDPARFARESLAYRTELHGDPLLDGPLEALVRLYAAAERTDELVGLYRTHLAQYPEDAGAKAVLIRILRRIDRGRAEELLADAIAKNPAYAPLYFLLFRTLEERGDPRAAETLSRAIDLEASPLRRREWLEQLLQIAETEADRTLAAAQFEKAIGAEALPHEEVISLARLLQAYRFWETSVKALNRARSSAGDPEAVVEVDMMLATALGQLGNGADAGAMLDALLRRLAPDHWRRREILALRVLVAGDEEDRRELVEVLEKAWVANPKSETAATDLAAVLVASERRAEAARVLLEASGRLPKSMLLESRTLELLEALEELGPLADYLAGKLEAQPDRDDLRFRLVKVAYGLGRDADAEQDFRAVIAGLSPEEASARILELQRHLREIGRIDAAEPYLERYLRNHPTRLDVARELIEVRLSGGASTKVAEVVAMLDAEEAEVENVIDLAQFLVANEQSALARSLVEARLATEPRNFDLGLLHAEILARLGDVSGTVSRLAALREPADALSLDRYRRWLETAILAHRRLETLPGFLDGELNRYQFDEAAWNDGKLERFAALCEAGRRDLPGVRVAEELRRRVAQPGLETAQRLRLRQAFAAVLEGDPSNAPEAEEQLRLLAQEDPGERGSYDLRRALVYRRAQLTKQARELLDVIPFAEVDSPPLLREAVDALLEFGMLAEAAEALDALTLLEPGDFLGWERRLTVLAVLGEEVLLRSTLRRLRDGAGAPALREDSRRALGEHLVASYWRSISARMERGEEESATALTLLAAVEGEELPSSTRLWTDWARASILSRLGRTEEAGEALGRFVKRAEAAGAEEISFPDGLSLSVAAAERLIGAGGALPLPAVPSFADGLVAAPRLRWIYELPEGVRVARLAMSDAALLLLDDGGSVHAVEPDGGKLLWRRDLGSGASAGSRGRPTAFDAIPMPPSLVRKGDERLLAAKMAPSFSVYDDRFLLLEEAGLTARSAVDGSVRWIAPGPSPDGEAAPSGTGARPGTVFAVADGVAVAFDAESGELRAYSMENGKLLWSRRAEGGGTEGVHSLNSGLGLASGLGFAYGRDAFVFDLAGGAAIWKFERAGAATFPVVLRPPREDAAMPVSALRPAEVARVFSLAEPPDAVSFLRGLSDIVGPAVHWSETRREIDAPVAAHLSEGVLWLMGGESVRRISLDLPMASRELPAAGSLVGAVGEHLWFQNGSELVHADFRRGRTTRIPLGEEGEVRATLVGSQVLVRAGESLSLFNALSGALVGRSALPSRLRDYILERSSASAAVAPVPSVWQGRIARPAPGRSALCLPADDLFVDGRLYARFGDRFVACLAADAEGDPAGQ